MKIPRTHCGKGHEFTERNTYEHKGKRHCRRCRAAESRKLSVKPTSAYQRRKKLHWAVGTKALCKVHNRGAWRRVRRKSDVTCTNCKLVWFKLGLVSRETARDLYRPRRKSQATKAVRSRK